MPFTIRKTKLKKHLKSVKKSQTSIVNKWEQSEEFQLAQEYFDHQFPKIKNPTTQIE